MARAPSCSCGGLGCDCCRGTRLFTPHEVVNRPGLGAVFYRAGTHAEFFESMKARLSSLEPLLVERGVLDANGRPVIDALRPLLLLKTRDLSDPSIALMDAWAVVGDILTFYQERIANEGYLRTATERRSVLELARLLGYKLKPGVASTVYLAYTIEPPPRDPSASPGELKVLTASTAMIPPGSRVQSVPGPGELPQTFETSDALEASSAWNLLKPRLTRPQTLASIWPSAPDDVLQVSIPARVYLKGISTGLQENDPLLLQFDAAPVLFRVIDVETDVQQNRTLARLRAWQTGSAAPTPGVLALTASSGHEIGPLLPGLLKQGSVPPATAARLQRSLETSFDARADTSLRLLASLRPELANLLPAAVANAGVTANSSLRAHALRVKAAPHGATAPKRPVINDNGAIVGSEEWPLASVTLSVHCYVEANNAVLFANANPVARVDLSIQRGDDVVTLDHVAFPTTPGQVVPLAGGQVNLVFQNEQLQFVFALPDLPERRYAVSVDDTLRLGLTAQQGAGGTWEVARRHTLRTNAGGHSLTIDFPFDPATQASTTVFRFMDELPIAVPEAQRSVIALDAPYERIKPGSWAAVVHPGLAPMVRWVTQAGTVARTAYGQPAKVTQLVLSERWLDNATRSLGQIRNVTVLAESEELELAEEPVLEDVSGGQATPIVLAAVYANLQSGRWLVIAGERTDVLDASGQPVRGINGGELLMLAAVEHSYDPALPGDRNLTRLFLARDLEYRYRRDNLRIYGNVVKATLGETRKEVLGSGEAGKPLQSFELKQPPLTFVPAPTPSGVASTLHVYVNDIEWHEADSMAGLGRADRSFVTQTDNAGRTRVTFGNGEQGARLPSGMENVRATYRNGIGKAGNVRAEQVSLLLSRPLGAKDVINPLRASGGADPESRDDARRNIPFAVQALDRIVSLQDYADFARTFGGIGKAVARRLVLGGREAVHLTIAGAGDAPIDRSSDTYRHLLTALRLYGDPDVPLRVDPRWLKLLVISGKVGLQPDYLWERVVEDVRHALYQRFSFDARDLGQDVTLSEVLSVIQAVPGVAYADIDRLRAIPEQKLDNGVPRLLRPDEIAAAAMAPLPAGAPEPLQRITSDLADAVAAAVRPAELVVLSADVPDTLVLNQARWESR